MFLWREIISRFYFVHVHCTAAARERKALVALWWCTNGPLWAQKTGWEEAAVQAQAEGGGRGREGEETWEQLLIGDWWSGVGLDPSGEDGVTLVDLRRNGLQGQCCAMFNVQFYVVYCLVALYGGCTARVRYQGGTTATLCCISYVYSSNSSRSQKGPVIETEGSHMFNNTNLYTFILLVYTAVYLVRVRVMRNLLKFGRRNSVAL